MTKQELEILIAEKVMGWTCMDVIDQCGYSFMNYVDCNERGIMSPEDWHPLTDKNQCFEALEAWMDSSTMIQCKWYDISRVGDEERTCYVNLYHTQTCIVEVEHKSLNAAICLALAEAVTGEKQTLEVE